METQVMIDDLLEHQEGIAPRSGAYLLPRRKARRNVQRAITKVWNHRSWPWKQSRSEETVTATPGDPAPLLPANFLRFDRESGVFPPTGHPPLTYASPGKITALLSLNRQGVPRHWSLGGQDTSGRKKLLLAPLPTAEITLSLVYVPRSPRAWDEFDADDPNDVSADEIQLIPEQWHETVLYEWAVYYQMKDKGNIQSVNEQLRLATDALKQMVTEEMPGAAGPARLPFYGRRW